MADDPSDPMTFQAPRAVPELERDSLQQTYDFLVGVATRKLGRGGSRQSAEDYAADALLIAFENLAGQPSKRAWDPDTVDLIPFCIQVIRSRISHERERMETRLTEVTEDPDGEIVPLGPPTPEERLDLQRNVETLMSRLGEFEKSVLLQMLDPDATIETIAAVLHRPVNEVRNARIRIHRLGRKIASPS